MSARSVNRVLALAALVAATLAIAFPGEANEPDARPPVTSGGLEQPIAADHDTAAAKNSVPITKVEPVPAAEEVPKRVRPGGCF